jgi:signal transduction histidine kinase/ActR/RegA family two-component response regulator
VTAVGACSGQGRSALGAVRIEPWRGLASAHGSARIERRGTGAAHRETELPTDHAAEPEGTGGSETSGAARAATEESLRATNEELETRVRERTAELVRSNASLAQSETRFRAFVSATADVIYRMSADWGEMRHLEGQDFIADTPDPNRSWLEKYIHPDDQARVMEAIRRAIRTKSIFELEHRVVRVDGTLGWTFSRAIPLLDEGGEIVEWFGAASDVTERKEAQLRLQGQLARLKLLGSVTRAIGERQDVQSILQIVVRTLEEELPVDFACVFLNDEGRMTVASVGSRSASLAAELALPERTTVDIDQSGLQRRAHPELIYEPDISGSADPLAARLARGGLRALVIAPLLVEGRLFGTLVTARREPSSLTSTDCEFLRQLSDHLALAAHQAQLYSSLQQAYEDLRQSQQSVMQQERLRALGQMASGVAHDINNALSPAALYVQSLLERDTTLSEEARARLTVTQRAIEDVGNTVARMRMFYQPREAEVWLEPLDINVLLQQVADLTRARWSDMPQELGHVIELKKEIAPDVPRIMGAESEIRDALTNLVLNAADAMPQGGTLTLRTSAVGARRVVVEVADTGIGMDAETRNKCLEPFFTTKGERGSGLGLAMVYGMAERHSADLEIESQLGSGTTVRLIFPAAIIKGIERTGTSSRTVAPLRILLVDDDPLLLKSLTEVLASDGHSVTSADGGQRGIDEFFAARGQGEPFGVVITDLGMPNVGGHMVAAAVKSATRNTPVILLTGWGQRLKSEGDLPAHVDRVLSKPPRLSELRAALAELTVSPTRS